MQLFLRLQGSGWQVRSWRGDESCVFDGLGGQVNLPSTAKGPRHVARHDARAHGACRRSHARHSTDARARTLCAGDERPTRRRDGEWLPAASLRLHGSQLPGQARAHAPAARRLTTCTHTCPPMLASGVGRVPEPRGNSWRRAPLLSRGALQTSPSAVPTSTSSSAASRRAQIYTALRITAID